MKARLSAVILIGLLIALPTSALAGLGEDKKHDFIPRFHNLIFLFDVSDSMTAGYPKNFDHPRLFVATRAFMMFNAMMPHVPLWQYDLNTALLTYGDDKVPRIRSPLGPWARVKYQEFYPCMRLDKFYPCRTAALPEGLQLAGSLMTCASGRTAVVIFTDGGNSGECPQKTATALKEEFGDKVQVYGIFFGESEAGWRNLYEVCKLTGGYCRKWEEVRTKKQMKDFTWDILVREIMFPYPEIFFRQTSADLIPSEALKLESVANFLHAIPQYVLQIDAHTTFLGSSKDNYQLALARGRSVKDALVKIYKIHPERIVIRSWGEELPRYDNQNPDTRLRNDEANLFLLLPLRNFPYDEKHLHTFGVNAVGDIYNTQERNGDEEWAWTAKPPPGSERPPVPRFSR